MLGECVCHTIEQLETYSPTGTAMRNFLVAVNCSPSSICSQLVSLLVAP